MVVVILERGARASCPLRTGFQPDGPASEGVTVGIDHRPEPPSLFPPRQNHRCPAGAPTAGRGRRSLLFRRTPPSHHERPVLYLVSSGQPLAALACSRRCGD